MKKDMIKNFAYGKVFSVFLSLVVVLTFFMFALRQTTKNNNTLIVGMMSGWAPFMSINNNGQYEGFDVDCAQELAARLNKKLIIKDLGSVASCFVALEQNKVDMIFSGLDITQARLEKVAMVNYVGQDVKTFSLIFWDTIPENIQSMEDFLSQSYAVVCAESGSAQEAFLNKYPFITKKSMNCVVDIILELRFGKSLAAVVEPRVARRFAAQNPQLKMIDVVLPDECVVYGCGIAIKKDNNTMINAVAGGIESMKKDGTLKALEVRWQLEEE